LVVWFAEVDHGRRASCVGWQLEADSVVGRG
jgi:hypothetical protein